MQQLKEKAISLGASDFGTSNRMNKKFYVIFNNKKINFGSKTGQSYIDHQDDKKRDAWYARHSKILNKDGQAVINQKSSASWWSARILWPR